MTGREQRKTDIPSEPLNGNFTAPLVSRNELVVQLLKEGQVPMLPFEAAILRAELDQHSRTQVELGRLLGQAMEQSSETWHDNAPADAINQQAGILTNLANKTISTLKFRTEFDYPTASDTTVTLGSVVQVRFASGEIETFYITGHTREVPEALSTLVSTDTTAININSPLGQALLGANMGDTIIYPVNGREIQVDVASFAQFNGTSLE